jgi:acetylornithine deacetylase/succinyl-diaminopimelate desuccinylase-like protein
MPDTLAPSVSDVVELTRALVRCESVTPAEGGALQLLERTLGTLGFRCERMDFTQAGTDDVANLYARIGPGTRRRRKAFLLCRPFRRRAGGRSLVLGRSDLSRRSCRPATCSDAAPLT